MNNDSNQIHDSLYAPNGGHIPKEGGSCSILLKKRYSSVVYCPGEPFEGQRGPGSMYPRCICLEHNGEKNGTLLATMEYYNTQEPPVFPVYESIDDAHSWHYLSCVEDTQLAWGCRFQPHLFELPCDMGTLKEGTILCAGNIIPKDMSLTVLHMYKSGDAGKTWEFVSEIVRGEKNEKYRMGLPVWEPFLLQSPDGRLFCYYSDERYKDHGNYNQLLAHKVSEDGGYTWSEEKIDVAFPDGNLRPGMPIVAYLPNGKFIMVYEMVNQDRIPVYFRISDSMDDWGDADFMGSPVVAVDGSFLTGTPYVTWIDKGGENGTILVTGRGFSHIFANSEMGMGFWEKMESLIPIDNNYNYTGYSQCILPLKGGSRILNLSPCQISNRQALIEAAVADVYVRS